MNLTKLLLVALTLLALGCGDKNKKEDTAPDLGGPADDGSGTVTESTTENTAAAKDPTLQQVVYFSFDQSDLDEEAKTKLAENYEWLKADGKRSLTVEGHTDEVGTPGYNLALGERRARTTHDYLVRMGIDKSRIRIITYGEERPASKQDAENRRSVFVATKKK